MNSISSTKKILTATAGTPVSAPNIPKASVPSSKAIKPLFKPLKMKSLDWKKIFWLFKKCIRLCSKIFWSSIVLIVLAHFVPELREMLSPVYHIIDILMACFSHLVIKFGEIIGISLG